VDVMEQDDAFQVHTTPVQFWSLLQSFAKSVYTMCFCLFGTSLLFTAIVSYCCNWKFIFV